jgi:hypothetical protein
MGYETMNGMEMVLRAMGLDPNAIMGAMGEFTILAKKFQVALTELEQRQMRMEITLQEILQHVSGERPVTALAIAGRGSSVDSGGSAGPSASASQSSESVSDPNRLNGTDRNL